jgi:hypothetical protein
VEAFAGLAGFTLAASTALRYSDSPKDDLSNVRVRISKKEEKELEDFLNRKHWGLVD